MVTLNQLIKNKRKKRKIKRPKIVLLHAPQRKGVCIKVTTTTPKKPNSAIRKICRVKLSDGQVVTASIPGHGHNLQKHSVVLIRGGRVRDVPGVKYKLIRGKYDLDLNETVNRTQARSKWGLKKKRKLINMNYNLIYNKKFYLFKKLINVLMRKGKKNISIKIFHRLIERFSKQKLKPFDYIENGLLNLRPLLFFKKKKKKKRFIMLPRVIGLEQQISTSLKWLIKNINKRKDKKFFGRVRKEIVDCNLKNKTSMKYKNELYKTLKDNKSNLYLLKKR